MQFIRVHSRASVILAIAIAATAIFASAASARVLEGPLHQSQQSGPAVPPILAPLSQSEFRATEAQAALAHNYTVPSTARYSNAELAAHPKPAAAAAVASPRIAAPGDSFHWGDAAIGAAIALAIGLLVSGVAMIARRRTQLGQA